MNYLMVGLLVVLIGGLVWLIVDLVRFQRDVRAYGKDMESFLRRERERLDFPLVRLIGPYRWEGEAENVNAAALTAVAKVGLVSNLEDDRAEVYELPQPVFVRLVVKIAVADEED